MVSGSWSRRLMSLMPVPRIATSVWLMRKPPPVPPHVGGCPRTPPAVGRNVPRRAGRPPSPQYGGGRGVGGAGERGAGRGAAKPRHALVHEEAAPAVVDAGAHVLVLVDAHAHAEDEAAAGEVLEGGGLLGHDGGGAQGQLQDAGAEERPGG